MEANEPQPIKTAVFDVCDTLYYSNTTHDFVRFVMGEQRQSLRKLFYKAVNTKLLPFRYALILFSVQTGKDILKRYNVGMLKGRRRDELNHLARKFASAFLNNRRITQTQEILKEQQRKGLRVILCSSSIEPVVRAIAEDLAVEHFVATSLEYDGDKFTGKITHDITTDKLDALKRRNILGRLVYAASDNTSDLELLSAAENSLVVIHGARRQEFWRRYEFETIRLNL